MKLNTSYDRFDCTDVVFVLLGFFKHVFLFSSLGPHDLQEESILVERLLKLPLLIPRRPGKKLPKIV